MPAITVGKLQRYKDVYCDMETYDGGWYGKTVNMKHILYFI